MQFRRFGCLAVTTRAQTVTVIRLNTSSNAAPTASRLSRPALALVLPVAAISLVVGCGSSSKGPSPTPSPTASTPSTAPPTTTAPSPTPTPVTTPTPTAVAAAACESQHLALQTGQSQGAAGSVITTYILRNAGTAPCTLFGFPGVSLLNSAGQQLGAAATRQGTAFPQFTLPPGRVASFRVQIARAGCAQTSPPSTTIRIYPPNQTLALTAPFQTAVCTAPSVTAVQAGIVS
jgi:hypothetical protein